MRTGERLNTATHMIGVVLALAGTVALLDKALASGSDTKILAAAGFAASMLLLYGASTLYHGSHGPRKALWAKVDHCAIYVLILGSYLPFALITLRGPVGWTLLAGVTALAAVGISRELWWGRAAPPSVPLYLAMGWIGVAALLPLYRELDRFGLLALVAGALLYSIGVLFYRVDARVPHAHGVWHLFVLGGTGSHFFAILQSVV
jgi:hemolysin III